ncbi:helix-turn-helix domain-containing protein [Phytoactinopolyspora mesophila]|uniref:Helix-turn-helix domain-containing protein n=1 Tax=Phytoactinopolyspora mesophila TaxID=2650750 RepID=A0A7K3M3U2_9ACTN|nr:XRE family transcriptional regulator [Phytoactinopolyspora mesophila]NDL57979.1 helix-turn-helix domain-containing protein [Phytoactinopolyspora mesophila]
MNEPLEGLGTRVREFRTGQGLSLAALAEASGVSRSMISDVEREARIPTVLVLARLASALGTTVSKLLGEDQPDRIIPLQRDHQPAITHPTGWERRILSPNLTGVEFEFIRTTIPAGVDVGEFAPHGPGSREYVAVECGELVVTLDGVEHRLSTGDSLYYAGDCRHAFSNPGNLECIYYTAMHVAGSSSHQPGQAK